MFFGPRFIDACRRRYGDAVTFGTLFDQRFVMVFHPALIKEVFQGPPEQLRAGEANVMLGPIVGERSVLLLDGRATPAPPPTVGSAVPRPADAGVRGRDGAVDGPGD